MFPGCKNNREDISGTKPTLTSKNDVKSVPILVIAFAVITSLGSGIYFWQKFKPCPEGLEKLNGICSVVDQPEPPDSNFVNAKKQKNLASSNNTSVKPSALFKPEWISQTNRILFKGSSNKYRDSGIKAFKQGNYAVAIQHLEKAVFSDRNDPEVQLYLNNAQAAYQGSPLKIAVVVPIDNVESAAREILRGIADAQTKFNQSGGMGGRLLEVIIANDGDRPGRAKSVARRLAQMTDILGIIGHNSSGSSQAGLTEYESANLVTISPSSTSTALTSNYFYRTIPSDAIAAEKLAEYSSQNQINRVAIFYNPHSSYSRSLQKAFESSLQTKGGNVLGSIDITDSNFDPRQQIQALQGQIDAIALFPDTLNSSTAIGIARANQNISTSKLPMLGGDVLYGSQALSQGGSALDDLVIAVPWFATNQPYAEQANQRWMGTVNWRTAASYDATQALLKAIVASPNPTKTSVKQNLRLVSLTPNETSGDSLSFINGERAGDGVLVQVLPGAPGRPREMTNGFKLIKP